MHMVNPSLQIRQYTLNSCYSNGYTDTFIPHKGNNFIIGTPPLIRVCMLYSKMIFNVTIVYTHNE